MRRWRQACQSGACFRPPGRLVRRQAGRLQYRRELRIRQQAEEPVGKRRPPLRRRYPEHPQPGHAPVGVDVEPHVPGHRPSGHGEAMPGVRLQRGARQKSGAATWAATWAVTAERRPARGVAHEVRGIQLDHLD